MPRLINGPQQLPFTLWKLTDGHDKVIKYCAEQDIAEIYLEHETKHNRAAKLYCCIEKRGQPDEAQEWFLHDFNCDLKTGKFGNSF
jgi:hypothetical protein